MNIIFWLLYFGGLIASFLLGVKVTLYHFSDKEVKRKWLIGNVCADGYHNYVPDGTPVSENGPVYCLKCHKKRTIIKQ